MLRNRTSGHRAQLLCVLATLCATPLPARARTDVPPAPLPRNTSLFRVWPFANSIRAIAQTPDGFLWFGTERGVFRGDGNTVVPLDVPGAPTSTVFSLGIGPNGTLWIGGEGEFPVLHTNGDHIDRFALPTSLRTPPVVNALAVSPDGSVWVGSSAGLFFLRGEKFSGDSDPMRGTAVEQLSFDRSGDLWATSAGNLWHKHGAGWSKVEGVEGITALAMDERGQILIATGTRGILRWTGDAFVTALATPPLGTVALHATPDGAIWTGTQFGLNRHGSDGKSLYYSHDALDGTKVVALTTDREGSLWAGTINGSGAVQIRLQSPLWTIARNEGTRLPMTFSIAESSDGTVWFTMPQALGRWTQGAVTNLDPKVTPTGFDLRNIATARGGGIWASSLESGLLRVEDGSLRRYKKEQGLPSDNLGALIETRSGILFVARREGGLIEFSGEKFRFHDAAGSPCQGRFLSVAERSEGGLWLGLASGGLCRFDNGSFFPVDLPRLAHQTVYSLFEDSTGAIWIGTHHGLGRYSHGAFLWLDQSKGLPGDQVSQVLEDGDKNLWLCATDGIARIERRQIDLVAAGRLDRISPLVFGPDDGAPSRRCDLEFFPSGVRTQSGELWFATTSGLVRFPDPEHVEPGALPEVLIDGTTLNGTHRMAQMLGKNPQPVGPGALEIRFSAASFLHAHRLRFRYRLDGFDTTWIDAQDRRFASYTNLPGSRYRFRVSAAWSHRPDETREATIAFVLIPPFHRTPTFLILCATALALAIALFLQLRARQARARFTAVLRERDRIAREFHDVLEQSFVAIRLQLATAAKKDVSATARPNLHAASQLVEAAVREARASIWRLRSGVFGSADLPTAIATVAGQCLRNTEVAFKLNVQGTLRRLPPETELHILRIVQEAITNALKHAQPAKIWVDLACQMDRVEVTISDDGKGFTPAGAPGAASGHFGVDGMRQRAEQIGAALTLDSQIAKGTRISFTVPIRKTIP